MRGVNRNGPSATARTLEPVEAGRAIRFGPPAVAVLVVAWMQLSGVLAGHDLLEGIHVLWRPVVTIASIMIMTGAAHRLGLLDAVVARATVGGSAAGLFTAVFAVSALTAAVLNNDAAVLLLTPTVVLLVRQVYPGQPQALEPFVFAVFMAAGVAPLVVSNPMNMVVAEFAGIGFNRYAATMAPIAVAGWAVSYLVLLVVFRRRLAALGPPATRGTAASAVGAVPMALLLAVVLVSYPVVSAIGGPVWAVAATGAAAATVLCYRRGVGGVAELTARDVSWETLAFLAGVVLVALGLRNLGLVDRLAELYAGGGLATIGGVSALGSALLNNHPMAFVNMLAIDRLPGGSDTVFMAALIGGDLGPRLLPSGSLAGLLWFAALHRMGVVLPVRRFVTLGLLLTPPALAVSLALLHLR